jgi:hypothetical protein
VTLPKTHATRLCAARCYGHIEIAPSRRGALAAGAWLAMLCILTLAAVDLPLLARIAICVAIATPGIAAIRRVFLLRGPRAVQALTWNGFTPELRAFLGPGRRECAAVLAHGSFRLGSLYLVLWLIACDRWHAVFIDGNRQQAQVFRALCRRLQWPPREP